VQNVACSIRGYQESKLRLGGKFEEYYESLKDSEWFSKSRVEDIQNQKLRELIQYSYTNIPYYNELFKRNHLVPNDIKVISDLEKIPRLSKEIVRNNFKKMINPNYGKKIITSHTSGSTGKALDFLFTEDAIQYRWALWFRHKARFGILPDDPYATFTGLVAVPIGQKKPPFWRENYFMNQTIFTMHHISIDKVSSIVDRLNKGGYKYYSGYPSILYSLATLIEDSGLKIVNSPKVIFTGAEALLEIQRERISKVFNCLVTDQYGFSEGAGNASRCENDLFHEDYEYGVLECLNGDKKGNEITGEVIGTGFTNLVMPFIRYEIGDTATWIDDNCKCGRASKTIVKVEGRNEDYVITPEGNKILRFDYIFKDLSTIKEAQIVQYELGSITIRIVKRDGFTLKDEKLLIKEVANKVSPSLVVKFEYPKDIERERTGKFRAVKSFLK
jgi:phenylacetate-CoA ligase